MDALFFKKIAEEQAGRISDLEKSLDTCEKIIKAQDAKIELLEKICDQQKQTIEVQERFINIFQSEASDSSDK